MTEVARHRLLQIARDKFEHWVIDQLPPDGDFLDGVMADDLLAEYRKERPRGVPMDPVGWETPDGKLHPLDGTRAGEDGARPMFARPRGNPTAPAGDPR